MIVPVQGLKLLGGDMAMLQDVVNHGARALGRHLVAEGKDTGIDFLIRHACAVRYVSTSIERVHPDPPTSAAARSRYGIADARVSIERFAGRRRPAPFSGARPVSGSRSSCRKVTITPSDEEGPWTRGPPSESAPARAEPALEAMMGRVGDEWQCGGCRRAIRAAGRRAGRVGPGGGDGA